MNFPHVEIAAYEPVKDALDVWAEWMRVGGDSHLGYGRCVGFETSSVSGWDDFETKVNKNLAINVQAIYEGLTHPQQLAIDHFHLHTVWHFNRINIEDVYADAIEVVEAALKRRGLL